MGRVLVLLCTLCLSTVCAASFCAEDGWLPQWADEFDGDSLDSSKWSVTLGRDSGQLRDAYGTEDNVMVGNGTLILRSQRQEMMGCNFTSGAVSGRNKAPVLRDNEAVRVCVSAKLPGGAAEKSAGTADGIWPAHWMMPNDKSCWPDHGEIDIMEMVNGDNVTYGTYHWNKEYPQVPCQGPVGNTADHGAANITKWASEWHEYATEVGQNYVAFYLDSTLMANITADSKLSPQFFPDTPYYVILNTAIGGPWPRPPTEHTVFPAYHFIDYVRVVQRA